MKKEKNPKVSVIMSVYNEPESYLRKAIESILNQTYTDFEFIIILDNPKNEKLDKIIKEYLEKDKRIVYLKNIKNLGLAGSLNQGIRIAKGKYIARMDADDISLPNRLKIQVEFMEKNKEIDLLFTFYNLIDEKGKFLGRIHPSINGKIHNPKKYFLMNKLYIHHPTLLVKSKILKENMYDETLRSSEDYDLWLRLFKNKNKYVFYILPQYMLNYRIIIDDKFGRIRKLYRYSKYKFISSIKNLPLYIFDEYFLLYIFQVFNNFFWLAITTLIPKRILIFMISIKDNMKTYTPIDKKYSQLTN
ncbi:MAG: glycosyltransferase [Candidatus Woesearchaeota archaeon]